MQSDLVNVSENLNFPARNALLNIMNDRISDYQRELENINLNEAQSSYLRGRIIELRDLVDLLDSTAKK